MNGLQTINAKEKYAADRREAQGYIDLAKAKSIEDTLARFKKNTIAGDTAEERYVRTFG